jgi:hypothetical protein
MIRSLSPQYTASGGKRDTSCAWSRKRLVWPRMLITPRIVRTRARAVPGALLARACQRRSSVVCAPANRNESRVPIPRNGWITLSAPGSESSRSPRATSRPSPPEGDLPAQSSGGDQTETTHAVGVGQEQELSHAPAVGMPDQVDLLEPERIDPSADDLRVPIEAVRRVRPFGQTMTRKVEHQHAMRRGQRPCHPGPSPVRVGKPVQQDQWAPGARLRPMQRRSVNDAGPVLDRRVHRKQSGAKWRVAQ